MDGYAVIQDLPADRSTLRDLFWYLSWRDAKFRSAREPQMVELA
jgi:hypothetical protein